MRDLKPESPRGTSFRMCQQESAGGLAQSLQEGDANELNLAGRESMEPPSEGHILTGSLSLMAIS